MLGAGAQRRFTSQTARMWWYS